MVRVLAVILAAFMAAAPGCKDKPKDNQVDLDQIQPDHSTDYRHIFRSTIHEQEEEASKLRKNEVR